jgi:hypothetical protein
MEPPNERNNRIVSADRPNSEDMEILEIAFDIQ